VPNNLVIIPTYNELDNIEKVIRKIISLEIVFDILIVDDNSPDGTAILVKDLIKEFPERLFLAEREKKSGLGTAYIYGFKWALQKGYEYIFEMDADFSHDPNDLIRLYDACANKGFDVSIGSRYITGANVVNWPLNRILISYWASLYVRIITGIRIKDTTAGFKCYKRKVLETIDLDAIKFIGYAFQIEMKFTAWKFGFKIVEIPIVFTDRVIGQSKMSKNIFMEAFLGVIKLKWNSFFYDYTKK